MPYPRRLVVRALLAGVACALMARPSSAQELKDHSGKPLKIGLQLYSVRTDCDRDLPGTLKAVAKMGYTGVEFAGYHGYTAEQIKAMLEEDRLECYGTHVDLNAIQGDKLENTIVFAKGIGCKFIVVPWLPDNRRSTHDEIVATAKLFGEAADRARREGMTLGWHNENYEWHMVGGETIWETFWANADKHVAMQFDIGNALDAGVQAAPFLLKYPERVMSVHVKDHSTTNPNALLGEGDENWSEVIPILKHKATPRWFIIEQESYGEAPLVCVEKCLHNFKELWNKYN